MNIGIDIDDCITETSPTLSEEMKLYFKGKNKNLNFLEIMHGTNYDDDLHNFFLQRSLKNYNYRLKANAAKVINDLKDMGNKITIITARSEKYIPNVHKFNGDLFKKYGISYDKLICDANEKVEVCAENNIELMIDDSYRTLETLRENGIATILFNSPVNKEVITDLRRVDSWDELLSYVKARFY